MRAAAFVVALGLLAVPAWAKDQATIQAVDDALAKAFNANDGKAATSFYTEDATLVPPGTPVVSGHERIKEYWEKELAGLYDVKLITDKVIPLGPDYVASVGNFSGKVKADKPQEFSGKDMVIYKKIGDKWLMHLDAWSMDQ